jgi:uncharacterized protein YbjT (DUF2867 family)
MPVLALAGATGALGSRVAVRALDAGMTLRVLARDAGRLPPSLRRPGVAVVPGDARDRRVADALVRDADIVFSCAGASVQLGLGHGWRGYRAIDTAANTALIAAARAAGRPRFVYVSVFHTPAMRRLAYVDAHERVAAALGSAGLPHAVVRPTGFHSAIATYVALARRGALPEIGDGSARTNPIADDDLADVCLEAIASRDPALSIDAGGPDVITRRHIGELAFAALGRPPRFRTVPPWLARVGAGALRPVHPRIAQFASFVAAISTRDLVAPALGHSRLADAFAAAARAA